MRREVRMTWGFIGRPWQRMAALGVLLLGGCDGTGLVDTQGPEVMPSQQDIQTDNGIFLSNGLNLSNGFVLSNGIALSNGLNLSNGLQFSNGIALSNGINPPDGVAGPYIFPSYCSNSTTQCVGNSCATVSSCTNSDLTKWIDSNPTGSLKILKYIVSCALPSGVTVRVNYRGTLYS